MELLGPSWFGSVGRASACSPEGPGLHSGQRHVEEAIKVSLSHRYFFPSLKTNGKISSGEDFHLKSIELERSKWKT